ncbi:MAG: hypothetical protein KUG57_08555, partial [Ilumatobacteraceae bacterium]|nr:hypothetical protein [Ilumatobacteraceae bacterium]
MRDLRLMAASRHPAQQVVVAFTALILLGTLLLLLPLATGGQQGVGLENALFMATSAATVTGLTTVSIDEFSIFGELVILALIQIGGFGIMTISSLLLLIASNRMGLRQRMLARAEIGAVDLGDLRQLVWAIARITLGIEAALATILFVRFLQAGYEDNAGSAA